MTTEQQFLSLVEENKSSLVGICKFYVSMGAALSVEDLFQEIVFNLWKGYKRFVQKPNCKTSTWFYRVAINVSISQMRKEKRIVYQAFEDVLQEDVTESEAEEMENVTDLYRLIQLLEQDEQALVFLYLENKSHKEIAEIMGISVSNVGTKIQRIKLKLRRLNNEERK